MCILYLTDISKWLYKKNSTFMICALNKSSIDYLLIYHITNMALVKIPSLQVAKSTSTILVSFSLVPLPSLLQLIASSPLKHLRARFLTKYVEKTQQKCSPNSLSALARTGFHGHFCCKKDWKIG